MSISEHTLSQDEDPAADVPLSDPATIPHDEGDVGESPEPGVFESSAEPEAVMAALSAAQYDQERSAAVQAAVVALRNAPAVHYTQDARRWDGINRGLLGARGQFPSFADCSSFVTWCLWNGMRLHNLPDTVNGTGWHSGYTGTQLRHGSRVSSERAIVPGDLAFYGSGWPGKHVVICIGGGLVISHGSEAGPLKLALHYRTDLMEIRRYIGGTPPPPPPTTRTVAQQQQAVNGLGYRPPLVVDNQFGPKTRAGVMWLQTKVGAAPDGEWGPDTEAKYEAYIRTH